MRNQARYWLPVALAMALGSLPTMAQVGQPALLEGTINYLDRATGDITVDDYGARLLGQTRVMQRGLTLSQAQLRLGQQVTIEVFVPYPENRPREVKTITILDDGR